MTAIVAATLLLAARAADASDGGGMVSINPKLVIIQIVNFGILVGAVYFIFRKWLLPGLQKRADAVRKAIEDAEKGRTEVDRLKAEHERQIEDVRTRTKEILADATERAAKERDEVLHRAKVEAQATLERAHGEIERERVRVVAEIRKDVADLTILAATRVVEREMDSDARRKVVDDFVASLDAQSVGK